jgi:DNA (cytosine-5)-methyltransferase 1
VRFGSVCSGIEAASVAWHPLGWQAAWLSEIEPFPCQVLKHHYPDVPNLGDMTTLPERIRSGEVEAPDLFCGGTPCQAFSVAGLRKSLDDARGNLSLTFCEIADAIDHVRVAGGKPAAIIFWENVPGVLSTKDNAFGCFLAGLVGDDEPVVHPQEKWKNSGVVVGPERLAVWRVLDAQYFGVAQRRRRVFVISVSLRHPRAWAIAESILPLSEGVRRDTAPSREAGQRVTPTVTNGPPFSRTGNERVEVDALTVGTLLARDYKGVTTDDLSKCIVQPTYAIQGSMIGRNDNAGPQGNGINEEVCFTQNTIDRHGVAYAVRTANTSANGHGVAQEVSHTLDQAQGQAVAQPIAFTTEQTPKFNQDQALTLTKQSPTGGGQPQCVAQPVNIYGGNKRPDRPDGGFYVRLDEDTSKTLDAATGLNPTCSQGGTAVMQAVVAPTLTASNDPSRSPQSSEITAQVAAVVQAQGQAVAFHPTQDPISSTDGTTHGLGCGSSSGQASIAVATAMQVRRLTPIECERLQGFPDGYTDIQPKGKPTPDGPRYKALGNSWAVPVVRWIGQRIANADI